MRHFNFSLGFLLVFTLFTCVVNAQVPKLLESPNFELSSSAEDAGINGVIAAELSLDRSGLVKKVKILAGPSWPCGTDPKDEIKATREAVKAAAMNLRFSPVMKDGKPEASEVIVTFAVADAYSSTMKKRLEDMEKGADGKTLVKAGVINGRAISLPKPGYSATARSLRISGTVKVSVLIDESGSVRSAGAFSGHWSLWEEARDAACGARFQPTVLEGKAVKVSGVITYNFIAPRRQSN